MATWAEVTTYIKSNYRIQNETESALTMVFDTGSGRSQLIIVMGVEGASDLSAVRFFSPFAKVDQISAQQFTGLADGTIFGLAAMAGMYGLVHNAFLANLDASEIETPLAFLTAGADAIEKSFGLGDAL